MRYYYAITENNVVVQVVNTSEQVDTENWITISQMDVSLVGANYNPQTGEFEKIEVPEA
jgi:hypothetical protein